MIAPVIAPSTFSPTSYMLNTQTLFVVHSCVQCLRLSTIHIIPTISTTLDIYSHVTPGLQAAAARHFDEVFSPKYNERDDNIPHESEAKEKTR